MIPILKKPGVDLHNKPLANLPFFLFKNSAAQIFSHLTDNQPFEKFQSVFQPLLSTWTDLVRITNDQLMAVDTGL